MGNRSWFCNQKLEINGNEVNPICNQLYIPRTNFSSDYLIIIFLGKK